MNEKQLQQAVVVTEKIMCSYYCSRDIDTVLDYLAPDATWIGPGEREKKYTLEDIGRYFELGKDAVPSCTVTDADLRAVDLGESICLVTGSFTIRTTPESQLVLEVDQRVSFAFRLTEGVLQVVHMHISNPYGEMKQEEYFPHAVGAQSYQYLQRLLREKSDVIDMITGNITGGLKGSNDDSMFSYFYVNEGLPRMLDLTYDEFWERTGGTAVGAVYPPDLPAALEDCARCFADGPIYSTEYRMEKKDGSLIWVLDSGRKVVDAEGVTRINSIVTDITPLKQALFDLEVERERYRIALGNVTGSMCEYDIASDLFTVYRQAERQDDEPEKLEFSHFSKVVQDGVLVHPEDGAAFLDFCTGQQCGSMEVRTQFFHPGDSWRWDLLCCSVITDITGVPVRSIGILKDITDETQKRQLLLHQVQQDGLTQLLNQTAVKAAIQTYLLEEHRYISGISALFMLDLDHFKDVNDCNGHLFGDEVLMRTARILESTAGARSIVGRTGGDEFIVFLKDRDLVAITQLADALVQGVHQIGEELSFAISCSIGIACPFREQECYTELFTRADQALYRAKNNGRNRWAMDDIVN